MFDSWVQSDSKPVNVQGSILKISATVVEKLVAKMDPLSLMTEVTSPCNLTTWTRQLDHTGRHRGIGVEAAKRGVRIRCDLDFSGDVSGTIPIWRGA